MRKVRQWRSFQRGRKTRSTNGDACFSDTYRVANLEELSSFAVFELAVDKKPVLISFE